MKQSRSLKILLLITITFGGLVTHAQQADSIMSKAELESLHRELDNPLAKRWSLVFQENFGINQGTLVDGNVTSNTFFFQPALPIPFGKNKVFTARPVFPIVTQPDFSADASGGKKVSGFGDIQMAALFGPGNAKGLVWGVGATFVFPTASSSHLGQGKWQAGPTVMLFHLAKTWNKGVFIQHWWSYAGDDDRADVALTDFQYVIRRNFSNWSLGMGPSIKIDWKLGWDDGVTIPIGLGYTKTALIGKMPVKLRLEPQFSIYRSSIYANVWNIRLQVAPVIKSPFF
ncbi:hypothetical protein [Carboxylicivirga sp. RSCT41]|uniref:hypothetical protein n=1 Tax=Carboxylicivirga agarovorans TaxID=3417570 RepID=UPI003D34F3CD